MPILPLPLKTIRPDALPNVEQGVAGADGTAGLIGKTTPLKWIVRDLDTKVIFM